MLKQQQQQKTNSDDNNFFHNTETLSLSYQAVCYAQVWRCWCPAGAPGSRCGRAAAWSPSWRRSRCRPRPPPCGTPPSPRPGGPPAVSGGQQQSREAHSISWRKDCTLSDAMGAKQSSSPNPSKQVLVNMMHMYMYAKYHVPYSGRCLRTLRKQ